MGVCFDPLSSLSWLMGTVISGIVRWYSHVILSSEPSKTNWNWHLQKHLTSERELIFIPIWSECRTQINCATLWLDFLEWCKSWYDSKVERVRMQSSWMSSRLNHWPSLVCTRKNNNSIAGQTTRKNLMDRDAHRDLTSLGYWNFVDESRLSCMSTISLDHTDNTIFTA